MAQLLENGLGLGGPAAPVEPDRRVAPAGVIGVDGVANGALLLGQASRQFPVAGERVANGLVHRGLGGAGRRGPDLPRDGRGRRRGLRGLLGRRGLGLSRSGRGRRRLRLRQSRAGGGQRRKGDRRP